MQRDDAQSRHAHGQHFGACVEDAQQLVRQKLGHRKACQHDGDRGSHRQLDGGADAVRLAGAQIVADDGHHAVVDAEDGHEHEGLHLEIDAEDGHCCAGEADENGVHHKGHHAADGLHGNGGDAYHINAPNGAPGGAEPLQGQVDVMVFGEVEEQPHAHADELSAHRGHRRACRAQPGQTEHAEDKNGIQNDVGHGARQLGHHGKGTASCGHQQLFQHALPETAEAEDQHDGQVRYAVIPDEGVIGLGKKERPDGEEPEQQKYQIGNRG